MTPRNKKAAIGSDLKKLGKIAFSFKKQGKFREAEGKYLEILKRTRIIPMPLWESGI